MINSSPTVQPARVKAEAEILEKGRWSQFRANEKFHSVEENAAARARAAQLQDSGLSAVDRNTPDQLCLLWEQK